MPEEVIPDTGIVPDAPVESIADVNAARQAWLSAPPPEGPEADAIAQQRAAEARAAAAAPTDAEIEAQALADQLPPPAPAAPPAGEQTPPPAPPPGSDPFAPYGGYDAVMNAISVQQALRTENGVRMLIAQGLVDLGYDPTVVRTTLDQYQQQAAQGQQWASQDEPIFDPAEGLPDEEPVELTAGDLRALTQQIAEQAARTAAAQTQQQWQPIAERVQEQEAASHRLLTDSALVSVLGPPPTDPALLQQYNGRIAEVLAQGQQYFDPNQSQNPQHVNAVIARASAEVTAGHEARYQAYLESKRQTLLAQPPNTGGGAAGEEPQPEPKNLDEARKMATAAGFFD